MINSKEEEERERESLNKLYPPIPKILEIGVHSLFIISPWNIPFDPLYNSPVLYHPGNKPRRRMLHVSMGMAREGGKKRKGGFEGKTMENITTGEWRNLANL